MSAPQGPRRPSPEEIRAMRERLEQDIEAAARVVVPAAKFVARIATTSGVDLFKKFVGAVMDESGKK